MATCTVSGTVKDPSGTALSGVAIAFDTQTPVLAAGPVQGSTTTATNGTWSLDLTQGLSGIFTISVAQGNVGRRVPYKFNVNIPATSSAQFSGILVDS